MPGQYLYLQQAKSHLPAALLLPNQFQWDFPSLYGVPSLAKFSNLPLQVADILDISSGGGGGYGDPLERDVEKVEWDVLHGYVSREKTEEAYGVWIDPRTGKADLAKTAQIRKRLKSGSQTAQHIQP